MSGAAVWLPPAIMQDVVEKQTIEFKNEKDVGVGFGLGMIVQTEPSHFIVNVAYREAESYAYPDAIHQVGEMQSTLINALLPVDGTFGVVIDDQDDPSHFIANV